MSKRKSKKEGEYVIKDHQLYFSRLGALIALYRKNKISKKKIWISIKIFFFASITQIFMFLQQIFWARKIKKVSFKDNAPIFILGHWRSGTTHLHYLISEDPNLKYPTHYHSFMINLCLIGKGWLDRILGPLFPNKRPMDNVRQTLYGPGEEEQSAANMTACNGIHAFFFPRNKSIFRKFMLLKDCSEKEKATWAKYYDKVLRIVTLSTKDKRLLIKSPGNTAKATELMELYPGAKFIYIHRNPYEVYPSTRKLYKKSTETQYLQDMTEEEIEETIIENYEGLMQTYLEKRDSIPEGDLVEISFEELAKDGMATAEKIYKTLSLDGFEEAKPHFEAYLKSVKNYQKNVFKPLPEKIVEKIQSRWKFVFDEWDYDLEHKDNSDTTIA